MGKTKSKTSPESSKKGCLCSDGTYKKECCNGDLQAQGIGSLVGQSESTITNSNGVRIIVSING